MAACPVYLTGPVATRSVVCSAGRPGLKYPGRTGPAPPVHHHPDSKKPGKHPPSPPADAVSLAWLGRVDRQPPPPGHPLMDVPGVRAPAGGLDVLAVVDHVHAA